MRVHLVDGTFELFRAYYGAPKATAPDGREVGATRGLLLALLGLVTYDGATHVACAFDHVIESFRNDLYAGYKTSAGVEPALFAQFALVEEASAALGFVTWPMVPFEADDALATAAARCAADPAVTQVVICSPDKDLAQCIRGTRVVTLDRIRKRTLDEDGVRARYGIAPGSIPDWLALVGDSADGYPGLPGFGEKTASALLARWTRLEDVPDDAAAWDVPVRGAARLAATLSSHRADAALFKVLATLRSDVPITEDLEGLRWQGARRDRLVPLCERIGEKEAA